MDKNWYKSTEIWAGVVVVAGVMVSRLSKVTC